MKLSLISRHNWQKITLTNKCDICKQLFRWLKVVPFSDRFLCRNVKITMTCTERLNLYKNIRRVKKFTKMTYNKHLRFITSGDGKLYPFNVHSNTKPVTVSCSFDQVSVRLCSRMCRPNVLHLISFRFLLQ